MNREIIGFKQTVDDKKSENLEAPLSFAAKKAEKLIAKMQETVNPQFFNDVSEDPNVWELDAQFVNVIDHASPEEIGDKIIPLLTRAFENKDYLRREYLSLRREALAALENEKAVKIVMDYYNKGKSLDKITQKEKRSTMMVLGLTDLEALLKIYWPKALNKAEEMPESSEREEMIKKINSLIRLTRESFNAVQKEVADEDLEDSAIEKRMEADEEKVKVIPFRRQKK